MVAEPKLFSYVVARDHGFAPNPFFGYCTLANCKPDIRGKAEIGDWIIGTSSKNSNGNNNNLVYFMKVTEILTFDEYWDDSRFQRKKPVFDKTNKYAYGDNIYHKENGEWQQEISHHRKDLKCKNEENLDRDTSFDKVLISDINNFGYFGREPIKILSYLLNFQKLLDNDEISEACKKDLEKLKARYKLFGIVKSGSKHKCDFPECIVRMAVEWLSTLGTGKSANPAKWKRKYYGR